MLWKLVLVMILLPTAEVALLLASKNRIGWVWTIGMVLFTGFLGAAIAKREGAYAWREVRQAAAAGRLPAQELVEGLLVFAAGIVLLTPGFITDAIGFLLMVRPIRRMTAAVIIRRIGPHIKSHTTVSASFNMGRPPPPQSRPEHDKPRQPPRVDGKDGDAIDVTFREL